MNWILKWYAAMKDGVLHSYKNCGVRFQGDRLLKERSLRKRSAVERGARVSQVL